MGVITSKVVSTNRRQLALDCRSSPCKGSTVIKKHVLPSNLERNHAVPFLEDYPPLSSIVNEIQPVIVGSSTFPQFEESTFILSLSNRTLLGLSRRTDHKFKIHIPPFRRLCRASRMHISIPSLFAVVLDAITQFFPANQVVLIPWLAVNRQRRLVHVCQHLKSCIAKVRWEFIDPAKARIPVSKACQV